MSLTVYLSLASLRKDCGALGQTYVGEETIIFGPFTLGRFGSAINIYALSYACLMIPFMALPGRLPVTLGTMNYAGPVFGLVLLLAFVDYHARGKRTFKGPMREVE
jgi:hypothetical protein